MTKPPASTTWSNESNVVGDEEVLFQPRFEDPDTGIRKLRLTSLPFLNTHIYPEAPISTPDGKRFIWARENPYTRQTDFWIADLDQLRVRQITDEPGAGAPVVAPDGKWFYYSVGRGIWRMHPETFEREAWFTVPEEIGTVDPIVTISGCGTRVAASASPGPGRHGAVVIDLLRKTARLVFEHPDCLNAHVQYSRDAGHKLCVQVNDGIAYDAHGNLLRLIGETGASLHVVNDGGTGQTRLNVGGTMVERVQGHQCWVGGGSRVITTTHRRKTPRDRWTQHVILAIAPGDAEPTVVSDGTALGVHFVHMHTTADGRYWVSDCNRTAKVYVGSLRTGRFKLFCSTGATFGAAQHTHPHPFFLADGKTIGWNSDESGVAHVYAGRIPEGFLDDLG